MDNLLPSCNAGLEIDVCSESRTLQRKRKNDLKKRIRQFGSRRIAGSRIAFTRPAPNSQKCTAPFHHPLPRKPFTSHIHLHRPSLVVNHCCLFGIYQRLLAGHFFHLSLPLSSLDRLLLLYSEPSSPAALTQPRTVNTSTHSPFLFLFVHHGQQSIWCVSLSAECLLESLPVRLR
jgi:hypothetical protein